MQGLIGRKLGMTQVYDGAGARVPVTVIEAGPCVVVQRKTTARDGYEAVQLGFGDIKAARLTKSVRVRHEKAGVAPKRVLHEFAVPASSEAKAGDVAAVTMMADATHVDVTAVTKGRGFQGVVRRHRMAGGAFTHGGHSKRRVGSIGMKTWPARVAKNKRMPGHMGHVVVTQQNLRIVEIRGEQNLLLLEGAVPGPDGGVVFVRKALKKPLKKAEKSG
jgi:large subunit ribosomal protein L3